MPNWCENDLKVTYSKKEHADEFQKFREFAGTTHLDFQKIVPRPADKEFDWYEWNYANWGTKWNVIPEDVAMWDEGKKTFMVSFPTAWCPPYLVIVALSGMFPNLKFRLDGYEQGVGFHAIYWCANGQLTREEERKYRGSRGG